MSFFAWIAVIYIAFKIQDYFDEKERRRRDEADALIEAIKNKNS